MVMMKKHVLLAVSASSFFGAAFGGASSYDDDAGDCSSSDGYENQFWYEDETEYVFVECLILSCLIFTAIMFELLHHKFHHMVEHSTDHEVKNRKKTGQIVPQGKADDHGHDHHEEKKPKTKKSFTQKMANILHDNPSAFKPNPTPFLSRWFNRVNEEFMVLGFLAVVVWLSNKFYFFKSITKAILKANTDDDGCYQKNVPGPDYYGDMLHFVEDVHMHLFFGMILYFACMRTVAIQTQKYVKNLEAYEMRMDREFLHSEHRQEMVSESADASDDESYREFRMTRKYFIEFLKQGNYPQNKLSTEGFEKYNETSFPYTDYINCKLDEEITEFIEFKITSWVYVMLIYGVLGTICYFAGAADNVVYISRTITILMMIFLAALFYQERYQRKKMIKLISDAFKKQEAPVASVERQVTSHNTTLELDFKSKSNPCAAALEKFLLQILQALIFYVCYFTSRHFLRTIAKQDNLLNEGGYDAGTWGMWLLWSATFLLPQFMIQLYVPRWFPRYCLIIALPPNFDEDDHPLLEYALNNWKAHFDGESDYREYLKKSSPSKDPGLLLAIPVDASPPVEAVVSSEDTEARITIGTDLPLKDVGTKEEESRPLETAGSDNGDSADNAGDDDEEKLL